MQKIFNNRLITYFLFILGFIILLIGAKWLIDGASSVGRKFGLPQMLIGLTIVALGTSLPELVINVFASIEGNTGLAIGNVVGSNIINTLLIIGVAATIYPINMARKSSKRDVWISLGVTALLLGVANFNLLLDKEPMITHWGAILFLIILIIYLFITFTKGKGRQKETAIGVTKELKLRWSVLLVVGGIAGLFFGGRWIVAGANQLTLDFGLSQSIVGMTIVAAATSLPELVTSILAATKKNSDLAVGNAIGSNLFNILLVLGVSALIEPIPYDIDMNIDLAMLIVATLLVLLFIKEDFGKTNKAISRLEGVFLIIAYLCFLFYSFIG